MGNQNQPEIKCHLNKCYFQDSTIKRSHPRFNVPVVSGGKVFVPAHDGHIDSYGLAGESYWPFFSLNPCSRVRIDEYCIRLGIGVRLNIVVSRFEGGHPMPNRVVALLAACLLLTVT